jgi:PKD repeat protein
MGFFIAVLENPAYFRISAMKLFSSLIIPVAALALVSACVDHPTACFTNDADDTVKVNIQVEFFSCSNDTETHHWDFGDSTVVENAGTAIKHTYKKEGNYTVTLTVRNGTKTDMATRQMVVLP